jgi:fatty acid desaturase
MKMFSGIPAKERWWLWAALLWVILSLGPGLELVNKPVFVGLFPLLFVWSFAFYIVSLILLTILCYRMTFHTVSENIVSIYDEQQQAGEQPAAERSADHG